MTSLAQHLAHVLLFLPLSELLQKSNKKTLETQAEALKRGDLCMSFFYASTEFLAQMRGPLEQGASSQLHPLATKRSLAARTRASPHSFHLRFSSRPHVCDGKTNQGLCVSAHALHCIFILEVGRTV